jgi:hypothetical protein
VREGDGGWWWLAGEFFGVRWRFFIFCFAGRWSLCLKTMSDCCEEVDWKEEDKDEEEY